MHKECFRVFSSLKKNNDIITTKPYMRFSSVFLIKSDYVNIMHVILEDQEKLIRLGSSSNNGNTANVESRFQKRLFDLVKFELSQSGNLTQYYQLDTKISNVWLAENTKKHSASSHTVCDRSIPS